MKISTKKEPKGLNLLLDTNIWRYISDADAGSALLGRSLKNKLNILIAPSVLYEALRTKDPFLRNRLVALMTEPCWKRLMPEAFIACREMVGEIKRLRPEWLHAKPQKERATRLLSDWRRKKGGFWDRARYSTESEFETLNKIEGDLMKRARARAKEVHHTFKENNWKYEKIRLDNIFGSLSEKVPGWNEDDIEPWRIEGMIEVKDALKITNRHPFHDWLDGEINTQSMLSSDASWHQFWLYEVRAENMIYFWLRWAVEMLQSSRKISDGTPCDAQLGAYLHKCDYFISADRTFIQIIDNCAAYSPVSIAKPFLLPGGPDAILALYDLFSNLKSA